VANQEALTLNLAPVLPELRAVVRDEVRAAVADAMRAAQADRLVTVEEAAALVGTSPGALRKQIARGNIPAIRRGGTVRLRVGDLLALSDGKA
jgi:excisionase family DNA binding protein